MVTPRTARRAAWGAMLAALALVLASHGGPPASADPAADAAAMRCAAILHGHGVTPAPGGCAPRP